MSHPQIRPFVLNQVEGLAIAGEAGVVQHLGDLQHHLSELVHGDDHHPFVGGLDPRLLQVLEKGIEVLGDKEVPPFQGDRPVPAGEEEAGLHLGCGDQISLGRPEKEGIPAQTLGVCKMVLRQFLVDFSLGGGFQKHRGVLLWVSRCRPGRS